MTWSITQLISVHTKIFERRFYKEQTFERSLSDSSKEGVSSIWESINLDRFEFIWIFRDQVSYLLEDDTWEQPSLIPKSFLFWVRKLAWITSSRCSTVKKHHNSFFSLSTNFLTLPIFFILLLLWPFYEYLWKKDSNPVDRIPSRGLPLITGSLKLSPGSNFLKTFCKIVLSSSSVEKHPCILTCSRDPGR